MARIPAECPVSRKASLIVFPFNKIGWYGMISSVDNEDKGNGFNRDDRGE